MDVKMIPNDPQGYRYSSGMFDGHIYLIDPIAGTATAAFDCETVTPHVDAPVTGGMGRNWPRSQRRPDPPANQFMSS
jgi:selenium-binding protein 1